MQPSVSVIVRSYNRLPALCELLELLVNQTHSSFEVVVVEQSTKATTDEHRRLEELCDDERINLLEYPPLGGPKARNTGVEHAKGELLIFIDDDDLPVSDTWIEDHEEPYLHDESLIGFTGRHITERGQSCPYLKGMRGFIRKRCMRYSWLKTPYTFAKFDENVSGVDWLHGTNASIRRKWAVEAGLWDTHVKNQDEHSFAFKLQPLLTDGYHLDFRKTPTVLRRLDIEGGMDKRTFSFRAEFLNHFAYCKDIVYKYHPGQKILFPLHFIWILFKSCKQLVKKS